MSEMTMKSQEAMMLDRNPTLRDAGSQSDLFQRMKNALKKQRIDNEDFYIVEGDLLMDEDQLQVYALRKEMGAEVGIDQRGLVGIVRNGKIVRWRDGLVLTYCVLKPTFTSEDRYNIVREAMRQATRDWEVTCGVQFDYRQELDDSTSTRPDGVLFPVRGIDAEGAFIASAFFPDDPAFRRRVLIDPSYFTTSFDRVGVLRHELGHVLGFRHEHIRSGAPAACPDESVFGTINLTDYDPQSTMHYFCGGVGSRELRISEDDKIGSQKVYGLPLSTFDFVA